MNRIQKLIDMVSTANPTTLHEVRVNEVAAAAQRELDCLNAEALCHNFTSQDNSKEYIVEL